MKIHALTTGTVQIKQSQLEPRHPVFPLQIMRLIRDPRWTKPLPIHAFLIEHPEGPILVDSGDVAGEFPAGIPRKIARKQVKPYEEIGAQLQARGVILKDLTVVITHLHSDHTGGLPQLSQARVLVVKKEFESAFSLMGRISSIPATLPSGFKLNLIEFSSSPLQNFTQTYPLTQAKDVWLISTPGHTQNHASVLVKQADHWVLIAGDVSYSQSQMQKTSLDGILINPRASIDSLQKIKAFCSTNKVIYLPCHDPKSQHRLEQLEFVKV